MKPDITPEEFWSVALKTGETISLKQEGAEIQFGTIANPAKLIASLGKST